MSDKEFIEDFFEQENDLSKLQYNEVEPCKNEKFWFKFSHQSF